MKEENMEIFMLSQFIDALDAIGKIDSIEDVKIDIAIRKKLFEEYIYKIATSQDFCGLELFNEKIDKKVNDNSYIYEKNEKFKKLNREVKSSLRKLSYKLDDESKIELNKLKNSIVKMKNYDVHLAYKLGIVDGMKIKATCIKL